jgi:hypothetical protein
MADAGSSVERASMKVTSPASGELEAMSGIEDAIGAATIAHRLPGARAARPQQPNVSKERKSKLLKPRPELQNSAYVTR